MIYDTTPSKMSLQNNISEKCRLCQIYCCGIESNINDMESSKKFVFVYICQVTELEFRPTFIA